MGNSSSSDERPNIKVSALERKDMEFFAVSSTMTPQASNICVLFSYKHLDAVLSSLKFHPNQTKSFSSGLFVHHYKIKSGETLKLVEINSTDQTFELINHYLGDVIEDHPATRLQRLAEYLVEEVPQYDLDGIYLAQENPPPPIFARARKLEFVGCDNHF